MCTAATYRTKDFYFGRTLDYDVSYDEEIVIAPRNYPFSFFEKGTMKPHFGIIGLAHVENGCPLYYDAINEKGLGIAGLNFVGNAVYHKKQEGRDNVASFELIPWILGQCSTVKQARELVKRLNVWDRPFHDALPVAQLHWMISDKEESMTVEAVAEGVKWYENPVGVLTNNPPFDKQMFALNNYRHLSTRGSHNTFAPGLDLQEYSRGMGAMGLPGDLSSQSRFVRAVFTKMNSVSGDGEKESVSQFFHILQSVEQQRGCCQMADGGYEVTIYTSCCNADKGIYYYTTYDNHQIGAVDMHREDLDGEELIRYEPVTEERIFWQNESSN